MFFFYFSLCSTLLSLKFSLHSNSDLKNRNLPCQSDSGVSQLMNLIKCLPLWDCSCNLIFHTKLTGSQYVKTHSFLHGNSRWSPKEIPGGAAAPKGLRQLPRQSASYSSVLAPITCWHTWCQGMGHKNTLLAQKLFNHNNCHHKDFMCCFYRMSVCCKKQGPQKIS